MASFKWIHDVKVPEQTTPNLLETAAREANITRITHVDSQAKTVLLVYSKYTILVYGNRPEFDFRAKPAGQR